ncbi:MAG TPA: DUF1343 domain-containing protein [Gemmatimonadaceae bacterium]|jgi:uncharacterized protein YbbC (DUF1343 family)|nr:DUF1343 domain-containing protein [Gemmatimonadaceae bacterium]
MRFFVLAFLSVCLSRNATAQVVPGISVLVKDSVHLVRGKRVGLITNHTGRDEKGSSSIDLLYNARGVKLTALFAPEHGLRGSARGGATIASGVDEKTGVRIYSLYGETKTPTARMLDDVDVIVYDIQDVGARMYTYVWTMTLAAEAAKKAGKQFIVADRPDPIRGDIVEGGLIEKRYRSFTGLHNVPLRYGLTPGELARYLSSNGDIDADPIVIPMKGYRRSMWWDNTGLEWIAPSPNIRDTEAALLYPGISFFEATNVSEGRGTDSPFRLIGARWLNDAATIARMMNAKALGGVRFEAVRRRIGRGEKFGGETIPMIRIIVTNRNKVRSSEIGAHLLREIYSRHPKQFRWQQGAGIEELSGSRELRSAVEKGGIDSLLAKWRSESENFIHRASGSILY